MKTFQEFLNERSFKPTIITLRDDPKLLDLIKQEHIEGIQELLDNGANPNYKNAVGLACSLNNVDVVRTILNNGGSLDNIRLLNYPQTKILTYMLAKGYKDYTALCMFACTTNDVKALKRYHEKGGNIDISVRNYNSETALCTACYWTSLECVEYLVSKKVSLKRTDGSGETALESVGMEDYKRTFGDEWRDRCKQIRELVTP
jgi:ankyrin repeat protein